MGTRAPLLVALAACALAAGCVAAQPVRPAPAPAPALAVVAGWREVPLPAPDARVLTIVPDGGALLVLGSVPGPDGRAPGAWTTTDGRAWRAVPLRGTSAYAGQAELIHAGVAGDRVTALGQAFGGAHSSPRLTVWSGSAGGLVEHEQPVEMFGGPHAIALNDAAARPGTALLVGQWDERSGRYGAAVWTSADGADWHRQADDPALASAPGEQTSALGATASATGFLVTGDTLRGASLSPLVWTSPDGATWRRIAVPGPPTASAYGGAGVDRAACDGAGCVLLGATTGARWQAECWPMAAETVGAPQAGPVGDTVTVTQGVLAGGRVVAALRVDNVARLATVGRDCTGWADLALPAAAPQAVVGPLGAGLLLATTGADSSRLWLRDAVG